MLPIVVYNSRLTKLIKVYCITITVFAFTKVSKDRFVDDVFRHERIHVHQWLETTCCTLVLLFLLAYIGFISWWCTLLSLVVFYALYGLEWLCKFLYFYISENQTIARCHNLAYYSISAEQEAYDNENDIDYDNKRIIFNWLKYLFKTKRL